jgi:crotonobetainyl-CoA:carnitine CoA-transferase CaiB-like acyl-CoA transferase
VAGADVVLAGYRPGALDRVGAGVEELVGRRRGLVVGTLSAWGTRGPWSTRRGFDSLVQAATGISWQESMDGVRPGALPVQALDHATGYLLAGPFWRRCAGS